MIKTRFHGDTMTVAELIAELQKCPADAPVITEGCDCNGPARSVQLEKDGDGPYVYITRGSE